MFPSLVFANPFIDIALGASCSEIDELENSIKYNKKSSAILDNIRYTAVRREYNGYQARSFYSCSEGQVKGYSFNLLTSTSNEAHELLKSWIPTLEYTLGEASFNSFISPYKERFEIDIKEGLINKDDALVSWELNSTRHAFLSVTKPSEHYELSWSW